MDNAKEITGSDTPHLIMPISCKGVIIEAAQYTTKVYRQIPTTTHDFFAKLQFRGFSLSWSPYQVTIMGFSTPLACKVLFSFSSGMAAMLVIVGTLAMTSASASFSSFELFLGGSNSETAGNLGGSKSRFSSKKGNFAYMMVQYSKNSSMGAGLSNVPCNPAHASTDPLECRACLELSPWFRICRMEKACLAGQSIKKTQHKIYTGRPSYLHPMRRRIAQVFGEMFSSMSVQATIPFRAHNLQIHEGFAQATRNFCTRGGKALV